MCELLLCWNEYVNCKLICLPNVLPSFSLGTIYVDNQMLFKWRDCSPIDDCNMDDVDDDDGDVVDVVDV